MVSTTWEDLSPGRRRLLQDRHDAAVARLLESGWRVAELRAGASVPAAWSSLDPLQAVPA